MIEIMGELLSSLGKIQINEIDFDVSMLSAFSTSGSNQIRIHNETVRWVFNEDEFPRFVELIIKAREKIKNNKLKSGWYNNEKAMRDFDSAPNIQNFPLIYEMSGFQYKVLETRNDVITILVKYDNKKLKTFMKKKKAKEVNHPFSVYYGYSYIYQLKPFLLFEKDGKYYEVFFQLPCLCVMKKIWMPLHIDIQNAIWEADNKVNDINVVDDETFFLHRIVFAVFYNNCFTAADTTYFRDKQNLLNSDTLKHKLERIFFRYTNTLISLLESQHFDLIVQGYFSFADY